MSQFTVTREKTFQAGAALSRYRRVRLNSGKLAYAGAADTDAIGTLSRNVLAVDDYVAVTVRTAQGTQIMVANEAISAWTAVYAAADGKIASSGSVLVGIILEAAGADGDFVEVMPATTAILGAIARTALTQDDAAIYNIPLAALRVHDAQQTNLPGTAATDDLALIGGTFGTAGPTVQGADFGGTSITQRARFQFPLPAEYVAGETVTLRIRGAMLTTVSDGTATVDAEVYETDGDGAVGADLCTTSALSINSLTPANKDFTITPTGLVAGDLLDVRITVAGTDAGNAGVMIPELSEIKFLLDIKG